MKPEKSATVWARLLRDTPQPPPPGVLAGFADEFWEMAQGAGRFAQAAATMIRRRAATRGGQMIRVQLEAVAQDIEAGLYIDGSEPDHRLHRHADGDEYEMVGECVIKDDETGEWVDGVCYRATEGPRAAVLCVTTQQRWDDRFEPIDG